MWEQEETKNGILNLSRCFHTDWRRLIGVAGLRRPVFEIHP